MTRGRMAPLRGSRAWCPGRGPACSNREFGLYSGTPKPWHFNTLPENAWLEPSSGPTAISPSFAACGRRAGATCTVPCRTWPRHSASIGMNRSASSASGSMRRKRSREIPPSRRRACPPSARQPPPFSILSLPPSPLSLPARPPERLLRGNPSSSENALQKLRRSGGAGSRRTRPIPGPPDPGPRPLHGTPGLRAAPGSIANSMS